MKNTDMPAMPIEINGFGQYKPEAHTGLTKREYFAAKAMAAYIGGVLANSHPDYTLPNPSANEAASESLAYADALLEELEKSR